MAWIESHQALGHHPKTVTLAGALGCSLPAAVGHLQYLWWWALDYAQDGLVRSASRTVVARACEWHGKPEKFWSGLLEAGFVEVSDEPSPGTVRIHDWRDYAGRLLEKRKKDAERKRALSNGRPIAPSAEGSRTSNGVPPDIQRTSGVPYLTVPNRTVPTGPDPTPLPPSATTAEGGCCPLGTITNGVQHSEACTEPTA
jgi:hypothetical protein